MTSINWQQRAQETDLSIRHFMGGEYVDITSDNAIEKYAPRDGSLLYKLGVGSASDVNRAVDYAQQAFDDHRWSDLPLQQRKTVLLRLADLLESHSETLALYDCLDVGKPITQALGEVSQSAGIIRHCAEGIDKLFSPSISDGANLFYQQRKPIGVVGAIIGWNFPLLLTAMKVGPALAMGNSLVLKPSEFSSLSASYFAALAIEAGVPAGVFNVVHGAGATVGAALAHHQNVGLLTFTGSSATGKQMMLAAGQSNMKRLLLECGGKSPYLVFDDCPKDLDAIAADVAETAFHNQGQFCIAGSRLLVQESFKDKLLPKILEQAANITPQDPFNPDTAFGALIHEDHLQKVLAYIDKGKKEGAECIYGGNRVDVDTGSGNNTGCYLEPTIFDNVDPQSTIAQEEIFGPVLSIMTFQDEEEAIRLANGTCYGLAAYAATENLGRAQRLGQRLNAGFTTIVASSSPSGGFIDMGRDAHRESGFGHEGGMAGLEPYTLSSSIHLLT